MRSDGDTGTYSSNDPVQYVFDIERVFKGTAHAEQVVVTARDGASCGLALSGNGAYLVFARNDGGGLVNRSVDGALYANLCGGTRPFAGGGLPAGLGDGVAPPAGTSTPSAATTTASPAPTATARSDRRVEGFVVAAFGLVAVAAAVTFVLRTGRGRRPA